MESITARRQINGLTKVDMEEYYDDVEIESLYQWIDRIPLSRPKRNLSKDFADGVLVAEIVTYYFPKMVSLHNYTPAASTKQKLVNWYLLNRKVLRKLDLELTDEVIRAIANGKPKVIDRVLMLLRVQIDKFLEKTGREPTWKRRELYYPLPDPELRLALNTPPSHPSISGNRSVNDTPPGMKSPRLMEESALQRHSKSEPASPRKGFYGKGEIPHGHPDRSLEQTLLEPYPVRHYSPTPVDRSYLAEKFVALPLTHKGYMPPPSDNVPRVLYEEKDMECQAKEETIHILNAKVRRLEHLLHLKDVKIGDLHTVLSQTVGLGYSTRKR